jgi:hypothetical protein
MQVDKLFKVGALTREAAGAAVDGVRGMGDMKPVYTSSL